MLKRTIKNSLMVALAALTLVIGPASVSAASASGGTDSGDDYRTHSNNKYVALGDSVAAGLGLPLVTGASPEDTVCGRSSQAYSAIVGGVLRMNTTNAACQGAVTTNLTTPQVVGTTIVKPQLDAAFANGTPRLLTLTAGANDVHWATFIGACFVTTCDTPANTAAADALLASLKVTLTSQLSAIQARSSYGRTPTTIVTGYYHPVSAQCVSPSLTASEIAWLNNETDLMNATIQQAVQASHFATFAPVNFDGHDICSATPWIQRPGVVGEPAAFHPNATGQLMLAYSVLRSLDDD